jgi:hypothetical protein
VLLLLLPVLVVLAVLAGLAWAAPAAAQTATWPVDPPQVLRGYSPPDPDWQSGHRGIDLAADVGDPVVAPASGTVVFASTLAGRGVVVVSLADGRRTTLEPVSAIVAVGDPVVPGEQVGRLAAGPHCGWTPCLHWGLRAGGSYQDPRTLLGLAPPVLLPLGLDDAERAPAVAWSVPPWSALALGAEVAGGAGPGVVGTGDGALPGSRSLLVVGREGRPDG